MTEDAEFDPWTRLGVRCGGYSSDQDDLGIAIFEIIIEDFPAYCTDIAARVGVSPAHVELWQYILCSAGLCEYGSSPRGCWPVNDDDAKKFLQDWKAFRDDSWVNS